MEAPDYFTFSVGSFYVAAAFALALLGGSSWVALATAIIGLAICSVAVMPK